MDEQDQRPTVAVELARRVGFKPIEHDSVVAYVQWLFCANDSEAPANAIAHVDGNRGKTFKVVVGVGCTNGVVVDQDGRKTHVFGILGGNVPHPQLV